MKDLRVSVEYQRLTSRTDRLLSVCIVVCKSRGDGYS